MENLLGIVKEKEKEWIELRRRLHACAEVGFFTQKTQEIIKERLEKLGIKAQPIGKAGLVCVLGADKKGDALLLRADMDALPFDEKSGEKFSAKNGCMHACGHDIHTTILLGVAELLKKRETSLPTPVKLLFQPAEEILQGAHDCVENGVLLSPKVNRAAALHVAVGLPLETGSVIVPNAGVSAPAADFFTIKITGKACHGSAPQNGLDALTAGAHILLALQEIIAREISVSTPAVLTVGKMQAGKTGNAIADTAVLEGSLRAFDDSVHSFIKKRVETVAKKIASAFRMRAKITFLGGCPCLINDENMRRDLLKCIGQVFDERLILTQKEFENSDIVKKSGGSEDFAVFSQKVPSIFFSLAAGNSQEGYEYPLHSPKVRFDEKAIAYGVAALASLALNK